MTIDGANSVIQNTNKLVKVDNWPMNLEATRQALYKTHQRLDRYQSALRLANHEIERRSRSLMALTKFIYQINQTLIPASLLQLTLQQALQMTGAPVGAIVLIDASNKALTLAVHKGVTTELSNILTGQQLGLGATVLMPHLVTGSGALLEQTSNDEMEQLLLTTGGLSSLVSLPIVVENKLLGTLLVGFWQEDRSFTAIELHFLMIICRETALALDNLGLREGLWQTAEKLLAEGAVDLELNAKVETLPEVKTPSALDFSPGPPSPETAENDMEHLLAAMMAAEDEVQQQNMDLQTLNTISEIINRTFDLGEILQRAVEHTQSTLQTDAAWVCLQDDDGLLQIQAYTGFAVDDVQGIAHLKPGESIEGQVVAANKACFIDYLAHVDPAPITWLDRERLQALALVPISRSAKNTSKLGGYGGGVLAVARHTNRPYTWSPRESRLLAAIANQLAVAIENAQLYDRVYEREVGLRWTNQMLRDINDMLLEKNAYLEGFVQDDLPQAMVEMSQILQYIRPGMTTTQQQKVSYLQTIMRRLGDLSKEARYMSTTLDTAFDETIDDDVKQNSYTGAGKPVRLKKPGNADFNAILPESDQPNPAASSNLGHSQPLSFADAVAAGLVPAHIMDKEQNS